jgi:predicted transcriptional regulator
MTVKQQVCEVVSRLPEDATLEDIQYHLYVLECLEQGDRDIADGKTVNHEEAQRRLAKWLG